jgi:NDP-sugar pyrophosphorylase family protein
VIGFILAAGFGTRLLPFTEHVPKALLPVCGVPLLKRAYDFFHGNGIQRIAFNTHHHPDQMELFAKSAMPDATLFHEQGKIRGTGGALVFAKDFLTTDDSFCVANVDIVTNADLAALAQKFLRSKSVVGLVTVPAPAGNGTIRYHAGTGEFAETRSQQAAPSPLASADFIGITFYKKEFLSVLLESDFDIIPVWSRAQKRGMSVTVVDAGPVYWNDAGAPRNCAKLHFDVLDRKINLSVPEKMVVDPVTKQAYPDSLDAGAKKRLGPYCWIGTAGIPEETTFSRAVVFNDAAVPRGVHIENAIVTKYGVMSLDS